MDQKREQLLDVEILPDTWPEREAWLRDKLSELPPSQIEKEISFFSEMFHRTAHHDPVQARREETLRAALEPKEPEDRKRFLTILEKHLG